MIIQQAKISIVIFTYNQENLIERAINSVLTDKEYIHEIIIMDDCSKDNTFEKAQSLANIYPHLIKPFKNTLNLGIFRNMEASWPHITGDILYYLAGDDEFCPGFFKRTVEFIDENSIDYINERFILISDFKTIYPDGKSFITKQSIVKKYNSVDLKIRNLIFNRSLGFSTNMIKLFKRVNVNIGVCAEGIIDIQPHLFAKKVYYFPFVGSVYYASIGISNRINRVDHIKSYLLYYDELESMVNHCNYRIKNQRWIEFNRAKFKFLIQPKLFNNIVYFMNLMRYSLIDWKTSPFIREIKVYLKYTYNEFVS